MTSNEAAQNSTPTSYGARPFALFHSLTITTLILTLGLITLGGHVHNTGASLACPDWPLCFGQVMPKMEGGVLIEHSHRLLAALVGLFCIFLVFASRKFGSSDFLQNQPAHVLTQGANLKKWSKIALALVIFQGLLGGLTVIYRLPPLISTFHLATSQIFLGVILYLTWHSRKSLYIDVEAPKKSALKVLNIVTGLLFLQILIGATVRHTGAGAACGLGKEYMLLCMDAATGGTTFWPEQLQSQFHAFHRYFGMLMVLLIVGGGMPILKWAKSQKAGLVRFLLILSHIVVLIQVLLGMMSVGTYIGPVPTTLHLTFASLLLSILLSVGFMARENRLPRS